MATDSYQIELSPQQFQLLEELAARSHRSREQTLASIIEQFRLSCEQSIALSLEQFRLSLENNVGQQPSLSLADRLRSEGLLGCLQGGPSDLSTNPDHMNGFGS
jgi:hypothetical protein